MRYHSAGTHLLPRFLIRGSFLGVLGLIVPGRFAQHARRARVAVAQSLDLLGHPVQVALWQGVDKAIQVSFRGHGERLELGWAVEVWVSAWFYASDCAMHAAAAGKRCARKMYARLSVNPSVAPAFRRATIFDAKQRTE